MVHDAMRSARELGGYHLHGHDGEIGTVEDLYFDDETWRVRYLVVHTGGWFSDRYVLVSPSAVEAIRWGTGQQVVETDLTRDQVVDGPDFDTERPVSRQHETAYVPVYGWPRSWSSPLLWGAYRLPRTHPTFGTPEETALRPPASSADPHLRSMGEVSGYDIGATDGDAGVVEDFLIDDDIWRIRYLVVDTSKWWFGRKVLVPPDWIDAVSWEDRRVFVRRSRDEIRSSREWDQSAPASQ